MVDSKISRLRVVGKDARSFLHNMSTNDIEHLAIGSTLLTAFLNSKGRIIDVVHCQAIQDDDFMLTSCAHIEPKLAQWLEQFLFVEDVQIIDESVYQTTHVKEEAERIKNGLPFGPGELCEDFNPLELGLYETICWSKGCYIGQEVISRLDTYSKLNKRLCFISCDQTTFRLLHAGQQILLNDRPIGKITSISPIYSQSDAIGLAVVKMPESNNRLEAQVQTEAGQMAILLALVKENLK